MIKQLPDKWVRKAIHNAINNCNVVDELDNTIYYLQDGEGNNIQDGLGNDIQVVNEVQIPCYDSRVPTNGNKTHYVLMTTQTNRVSKTNKCEDMYESSILLDVVTIYNGSGNTGSRVLADNILDKVRDLTNNLVLDVSSNLVVQRQTQDFPNDLVSVTKNQNVFRKLMRLELTIV
tara:strand:- start:28 stop:552 length:525 start_codon:yes stop_codon:yes gene_type:complete